MGHVRSITLSPAVWKKKSATVVSTTAGTQAGDTKYQVMLELYWDKGLQLLPEALIHPHGHLARSMPSVQYAAIPHWDSVLMNNLANYTEIQFSFAQYLHTPWPSLLVLMWSSLSQPIMQAPCFHELSYVFWTQCTEHRGGGGSLRKRKKLARCKGWYTNE